MNQRQNPAPTRSRAKKAGRLVRVDPSLKKAYDTWVAAIRAAQREGASAFDELWEAVAKIVEHDPPLFTLGGYKNQKEFFLDVLHEPERNAYRFMRVAKFASPHEEDRYGTSKLDAALGYIEAKVGHVLEHPPVPIAFDRLKIPVRDDKGERKLALEDASYEQIKAATRALSKGKARPKDSLVALLEKSFAKTSALKKIRVRRAAATISFVDIPLTELDAFVRAISSASVKKALKGVTAPPPARNKKRPT